MKIIASVVSNEMKLIGFQVEGKASEFGELGTEKVMKFVSVEFLQHSNFKNNQIVCTNGKIIEQSNFKMNNLKMFMLDNKTGHSVPVNNTIKLVQRYTLNNENIGFDVVLFGDVTKKYRYADVIALCGLFKPENFVIKTNENGKQFIAGKSGSPLSNLPEIVINDDAAKTKKTKSTTVKSEAFNTAKDNGFDVIEIFDWLQSNDSYIIKMPGTDYKATGAVVDAKSDEFTPIDCGELGSAKLEFSANKLNATCNFKVPGIVNIGTGGFFGGTTINTFMFRKKNVFHNGKNILSRVGIVVTNESKDELMNKFGKSIAIKPVTEKKIIDSANMLVDCSGRQIFELDFSNLDLMSVKNAPQYILPADKLYKTVCNKCDIEVALKYLRGKINDLNDSIVDGTKIVKEEKISPMFAGRSKEELERLKEAGIDIKNGSFVKKGESKKNEDAVTEDIIELDYVTTVDPGKFTYKKLLEVWGSEYDGFGGYSDQLNITKEIIALLENVGTMKDIISDINDNKHVKGVYLLNALNITDIEKAVYDNVSKLILSQALKSDLEETLWGIRRTLWLHKVAALMLSTQPGEKKFDTSNWEYVPNNRSKVTYTFQYKGTDMCVKAKGIAHLMK